MNREIDNKAVNKEHISNWKNRKSVLENTTRGKKRGKFMTTGYTIPDEVSTTTQGEDLEHHKQEMTWTEKDGKAIDIKHKDLGTTVTLGENKKTIGDERQYGARVGEVHKIKQDKIRSRMEGQPISRVDIKRRATQYNPADTEGSAGTKNRPEQYKFEKFGAGGTRKSEKTFYAREDLGGPGGKTKKEVRQAGGKIRSGKSLGKKYERFTGGTNRIQRNTGQFEKNMAYGGGKSFTGKDKKYSGRQTDFTTRVQQLEGRSDLYGDDLSKRTAKEANPSYVRKKNKRKTKKRRG